MNDPERLRAGTENFLEKCFLTDVVLLYSPSQVALAAILHAASKLQENLDSYVTDTLFGVDGRGKLDVLIEAVRSNIVLFFPALLIFLNCADFKFIANYAAYKMHVSALKI